MNTGAVQIPPVLSARQACRASSSLGAHEGKAIDSTLDFGNSRWYSSDISSLLFVAGR